jgi:hypothetical protein
MSKMMNEFRLLFKYQALIKEFNSYNDAYVIRFIIAEDKQLDMIFRKDFIIDLIPRYDMSVFNDKNSVIKLSIRESIYIYFKIQMLEKQKKEHKLNAKINNLKTFINENVPDIETALSESWFSLMKKLLKSFWLTKKITSILSKNKQTN